MDKLGAHVLPVLEGTNLAVILVRRGILGAHVLPVLEETNHAVILVRRGMLGADGVNIVVGLRFHLSCRQHQ